MDPQDPKGNQDPNTDPDKTGNNDVVISDDELSGLDEETSKKIKTLFAQKNHWREKAQKALDKVKELEPKVQTPAPNLAPAPAPVSPDPEIVVRKVAMDLKKEEYLGSISEDKRASVKEFYESITSGKDVSVGNFNEYMGAAMRAAGVEIKTVSPHRISTVSGGAIPPSTPPGPTQTQIEIAKKAGLDPNDVYGEKVDYSNMLNAHKFIDKKEDFN